MYSIYLQSCVSLSVASGIKKIRHDIGQKIMNNSHTLNHLFPSHTQTELQNTAHNMVSIN